MAHADGRLAEGCLCNTRHRRPLWCAISDREQANFEKDRFLQKDQQIFNLGAASHMAAVAFDKHVQFCELYMSEVHEAVGTLFREGPTPKAMEHAGRLFDVNRRFAAWIPKIVALKPEPFENALRKLGAQANLVNQLQADQGEARSNAIDKSYALFMNVMDLGTLNETDPDHKKEVAIENVKEEVRSILGINELERFCPDLRCPAAELRN
jgi:hypothetical protein